ncbi:phage tail sheath family protein [Rouxiella sp. WC2420]|uniref:Phage tail sheath family protein n=1 Tax=Rouxiella sp. WC2420 TaxID=3234145 RepID=A0AB39VXR1_9GAMM
MPITTNYPGVYVKEDNALSMSISSGSTCVPLFVFDPFIDSDKNKTAYTIKPEFDKIIKVDSWLDYLSKLGGFINDVREKHTSSIIVDKIGGDKKDHNKLNESNFFATESYYRQMKALGYFPLQMYFENGGGGCYIYLTTQVSKTRGPKDDIRSVTLDHYDPDLTKIDFTTLAEQTLAYPDITIISLGGHKEINEKAYLAISSLLTQANGHAAPLFCVTGSDDITDARSTYNVGQQTAAYYPYFNTSYTLSLNDLSPNNIHFEGISEDGTKILDKTSSTLSSLLTNPSLSRFARQAIVDLQRQVVLSPVYAVLGAYCKTDSERGVWKAPANITLSGVTGLCNALGKEVVVTESVNGTLLKNGINAIRYFPSTGYTIWGARTMVPDTDLTWRYIPVRRLFNIAERDIKEAMAKAVFEPNSPVTWEILRSAVDAYLYNLWKQGALFGEKPEQAYFVKIGLGTTMTAEEINDGKMIIKVGMAAVRPAEFIILEFSQKQI